MNDANVVSLAVHRKARLRQGAGAPCAGRAGDLPGPDDLYQLLDRNISITVWSKNRD